MHTVVYTLKFSQIFAYFVRTIVKKITFDQTSLAMIDEEKIVSVEGICDGKLHSKPMMSLNQDF